MANLKAQVPQLINYQGRVVVGATDFTGTGQFAFALVNTNGSTTYWSNDGTSVAGSQPTAAVSITVTKGLYSVLLGDASITHMTAVPASVFANSDVRLRVWFNDGTHGFQKLAPDQRIAAVGYAMVAGSVASGGVTSGQLAANLSLDGTVTLTNGDLFLPATTDGTAGVLNIGGTPFLHAFGTQNTFVGSGAGNFTMTGGFNLAEGYNAFSSNTTGRENTSLGVVALHANTTGSYNTAIGYEALTDNTTGTYNTATGFDSLTINTTGAANTADGIQTLYLNATGSYNIAMGDSALYSNTSGSNNSALGSLALFSNTTGNNNTAVGNSVLYTNTNGADNSALGEQSLYNNTSGFDNAALGSFAANGNTTGFFNVAIGFESLFHSGASNENVAVGYDALYNNTGSNNVAVGFDAGKALTSGGSNVFLGESAGSALQSGDNNIYLGDGAGASGTESNVIRIGNFFQTATYITGIDTATVAFGAPVYITSDAHLGTVTSSRRFKNDIRNMGDVSDVLLDLRPVTFHYKPSIDPNATPEFGLIAEEVAKVDPDLIIPDKNGKPYTVRYDAVNAMLLNEFQKQHAEMARTEARAKAQDETIQRQEKALEELRSEMTEVRREAANRSTRH